MSDFTLSAEQVLNYCTRLRCFMSFDIIGSTAFKQTGQNAGKTWAPVFQNFVQETQSYMTEAWKAAMQRAGLRDGTSPPEPEFWQFRGDEVIFTKSIDHLHSASTVSAIAISCIEVLTRLRKSLERSKLDVKATLWIAGFPINNLEMPINMDRTESILETPIPDLKVSNMLYIANKRHLQENEGQHFKVRDITFIGPSVDLGFRLCGHSSRRMMVVSPDFALLLLKSYIFRREECEKVLGKSEFPSIHYRNDVALKGVTPGEDFPLLWIDTETDPAKRDLNAKREAILYGSREKSRSQEELKEFLEVFLDGSTPVKSHPYIMGTDKLFFGDPGELHRAQRDELMDSIQKELDSDDFDGTGVGESIAQSLAEEFIKAALESIPPIKPKKT